jgi:hypothetical protein
MVSRASPTRFSNAGDQTIARHVAETNPTDAELAINRPAPTAKFAPQPNPNEIARPKFRLGRILLERLQGLELLAKLRFFGVR